MTAEEYAALQTVISQYAVAYAKRFTQFFLKPEISPPEWLSLLALIFPQIEKFRVDSATLARQFYDSQRVVFHPELPRHDQYLEPYRFDWFVQNMEPVRTKFQQRDSPPAVVDEFSLRVVRDVENAGRRQLIHAVENDSAVAEAVDRFQASDAVSSGETRLVKGWARIATGRETCAWCLMLVSRGPVYKSAQSGGARVDDSTVMAALRSDAEVKEWMDQWHTGCDCKVVPVFDTQNWPGRDASIRAEGLWIEASKRATASLNNDPDKKYFSFKENRWVPTTHNREAINQLRQMIDNGEIGSAQWAALQAA